jgi:dethiobiotin synthase
MEGIFVVGVDTNVGKTLLSAGLLKLMHGSRKVAYWKPVQTGTILGDDTNEVRSLTEFGPECFLEPAYRFPDPVAPRYAAKKWGKQIELSVIVDQFKKRENDRFLIVEGAGGFLVPLNDELTQKDLIKALDLPVLLVAEDRVGAINHTVLTIEAVRHAGPSQ